MGDRGEPTRRHSLDTVRKGIQIRTGVRHKVVVAERKYQLFVQLFDATGGRPLAGLDCSVNAAGRCLVLRSDNEGRLQYGPLPLCNCSLEVAGSRVGVPVIEVDARAPHLQHVRGARVP